MGTLHDEQYEVMISGSLLLRMRTVSEKSCRKNKKHILYSLTFFSETRAFDETL
jgi:hypothetical protein